MTARTSFLPYQGHTAHVVNGVLVIVQGNGLVYERVPTATYTEQETSFGQAWKPCPPVPGSPAAMAAEGAA